jgi:putative aldouronate transport system permease protein
MMYVFFSVRVGLVNHILGPLGIDNINFLAGTEWFRMLFVGSSLWQNMGFGMIIYLAALASVSPELHEAAIVDGATKFRRIVHIDFFGILPTISIMLILNIGSFLGVGFEKIYLMQNATNLDASEVIQTYVYKMGLQQLNYSFSAAVGLFNSVINFILLIGANYFMKRYTESSLW